jgi:hypothetical protein
MSREIWLPLDAGELINDQDFSRARNGQLGRKQHIVESGLLPIEAQEIAASNNTLAFRDE